MKIYFLFVTLIVVLIGCNTPSSTTSIETISEDSIKPQGIKRGIINVLSAVTDASCNYALFVPNDSCNAYPLIVIFDPHAAGNHAASQYKELAGKYNVVLAASNKIQNNMPSEEFMYFASCIIDDVMQKIPIDSEHVYLMGFSGGARVASFLAQQENIFKGVIGCGAGLTDLVNIKSVSNEAATIEILDITGKQVRFENIIGGRATVDLNNLVEGIYLYQIRTLKGEISRTGKLIVNP